MINSSAREKKCKKCDGYVVGRDALLAMVGGLCSHCQSSNKRATPLSEEQKVAARAHRAANLANRAMANQGRRNKKK